MGFLTRTILILSLVSLFADISSEMLYPVMPAFLDSIGFGKSGIGLLEGLVALIAGFGKLYFGSWSDLLNRRVIFIRSGYFLSALAKPLMGLFPFVAPVAGARSLDRLGKGMRGSARDALLVAESAPEDRGKVFGFHRGMDTLGAVFGPLLALLYLYFYPGEYLNLFLIAFVPGMIGVALTLLLPADREKAPWRSGKKVFAGIFGFWKEASPQYRRLLAGFVLFSFLNSTDFFLLLRAGELSMGAETVIAAFIVYNLVYALAAFPIGALGDRLGFKPMFLGSVLVFALCYFLMGMKLDEWMIWGVLALYGIFQAAHDGIAKSWLSLHIPKEKRATGMGLFLFLNTIALLLANLGAGLLWDLTNGETTFTIIGVGALLIFFVLLVLWRRLRV